MKLINLLGKPVKLPNGKILRASGTAQLVPHITGGLQRIDGVPVDYVEIHTYGVPACQSKESAYIVPREVAVYFEDRIDLYFPNIAEETDDLITIHSLQYINE